MCGNILCIATVLLGIDAGWKPLPEGGVEYLIQIEPDTFQRLSSGDVETVLSYLRPEVRASDVRAIRITVGTGELPQELPPAVDPTPSVPATEPQMSPFLPPLTMPNALRPDPTGTPLTAQRATHVEQLDVKPKPKAESPSKPTPQKQPPQEESTKPWLPLTLALLGLFVSLGANVFLVWIVTDFRGRYRALVRRTGEAALE